MEKFLETWKLPKLTQEEIENVNRSRTSKERDDWISNQKPPNLKKKKKEEKTGLIGEFYQTFKVLTLTLYKLFQKIQEEGTLPDTFYKANITLIPKQAKIPQENHRPVSLWIQTQKSSTKYQQTKSNDTLRGLYTMTKRDLPQECKGGST